MIHNKQLFNAIKEQDDNLLFKLVYRHYFSMVQTIVFSYNGSQDDVKDVFQEMLIILIREVERGNVDENKNLKNYIYTISKNVYVNILKKDSKLVSIENVHDKDMMYEKAKSHIELRESENLVLDIIKQLGDKCYEILKAIIFENKKQEEIAKELGFKDRKVVKTSKNRCKKKLIELLQNKPKLSLELLRNEDRFGKYITITK